MEAEAEEYDGRARGAAARRLGFGIGWRPEIDVTVRDLPGVEFVEAIAEGLHPDRLPDALRELRDRGVPVVPHGVSLNLGGAEPPDASRLAHLAAVAQAVDAPLVSEHLAFCRAGDLDSGHLLPIPRTRDALAVVAENVRIAQASLPVPLAVENIAPLMAWPDDELTEGRFLSELAEQTSAGLLVDVANLHTARVNTGQDPAAMLEELPLERIAYVHVAGGVLRDGVWHDTHTQPVSEPVLEVLAELAARAHLPGVLLERDGAYPPDEELAGELTRIRRTVEQAPAAPGGPLRARPGRRRGPRWRRGASAARRARLAGEQRDLLATLVAGADVPPGFNTERIAVQSTALVDKRLHVVGALLPGLVDALGERFAPVFRTYAAAHPRPAAGARADARAFTDYARATGAVPPPESTSTHPQEARALPTRGGLCPGPRSVTRSPKRRGEAGSGTAA